MLHFGTSFKYEGAYGKNHKFVNARRENELIYFSFLFKKLSTSCLFRLQIARGHHGLVVTINPYNRFDCEMLSLKERSFSRFLHWR